MTGSQVLAENKLFATLDPTTRQLVLPGNQKLLLTDTVGFIRRLPHGLVEAFKATLEEVLVADFLIHVADITSPHFEKHRETTLSVLAELGAGDKPIVNVFNKVDLADAAEIRSARQLVPDALLLSARTGAGVAALEDKCREMIAHSFGTVQLLIPLNRYDLVAKLHELGHVQSQEHGEDGVLVTGRFPPTQAKLLAPFVLKKPRGPRKP
jgi:GTP-binding protein HflX